MKRIKLLAVVAVLFAVNAVKSQETIKIMYYNLLNFPSTSQQRADTLKKIVQYVLPDMFVVNELDNQFGATLILNNALNQNGINYYQQAAFVDGPDTDNLLFYNSNKLGLVSQNEIQTALRDINEYVMYYKAPDLATTLDTAYFYMYSCHLKASSTAPNPDLRYAEAQVLKNYLSSRSGLENVFVGGDFNFYGSSVSGEPAFNWILNGGTVPLYDPINMIGEWHVNSLFVDVHTQSTRTTSFDGGATGGLDDRFDFIFISDDIQSGSNKVKYIANSYTAVGQDGAHYNTSLVNPTTNGVVPDYVANALYEMSDHLPVYMEVEVGGGIGIEESTLFSRFVFNSASNDLDVYFENSVEVVSLSVFDLTGKIVSTIEKRNTTHVYTELTGLSSGVYLVNVKVGSEQITKKVVVL